MKIIKITNHLYDCFVGDGWENWSRWRVDSSGKIAFLKGKENKVAKFGLSRILKEKTHG